MEPVTALNLLRQKCTHIGYSVLIHGIPLRRCNICVYFRPSFSILSFTAHFQITNSHSFTTVKNFILFPPHLFIPLSNVLRKDHPASKPAQLFKCLLNSDHTSRNTTRCRRKVLLAVPTPSKPLLHVAI